MNGAIQVKVGEALIHARVMVHENRSLSPIDVNSLQTLIDAVELLMIRAGLNSDNSSLPPSKDPYRIKRKRGTVGIKRKPGGQKGHPGSTLTPVDNPNEIEEININKATLPPDFYRQVGYEARQVFDIQMSVLVKEYRAEVVENQAGEQWVAQFPEGVTQPAQYGSHTKATSVYLSIYQLIPLDRVRQYFFDQADLALSKGSVANFNQEASDKLDTFEVWVKKQILAASNLHADETGINIGGEGAWLHTLSNDKVTWLQHDKRRGPEAMERIGLLPHFKGNLIHDHWKSYFQYAAKHTLCNAHHLRELEWAAQFENQAWAKQMKELLIEINAQEQEIPLSQQAAYEERYRAILKAGETECPVTPKLSPKRGRIKKSKSRNLLERLQAFEAETLRFMREPDVPFTNNQGERDLRMAKVQQKISGCFRSENGARTFFRVRSYLATCQKQGVNPMLALKLLFNGELPPFMT